MAIKQPSTCDHCDKKTDKLIRCHYTFEPTIIFLCVECLKNDGRFCNICGIFLSFGEHGHCDKCWKRYVKAESEFKRNHINVIIGGLQAVRQMGVVNIPHFLSNHSIDDLKIVLEVLEEKQEFESADVVSKYLKSKE